ncbi:HrpE/YscL family type III secretion apparatus protein [Alcaligenes sp. Marseille-Q7550]
MAFLISRSALTSRKLAAVVAPSTRVLRAGEYAAWAGAQALIHHAQEQADQILAGAQAAFEAQCQRGYEDGRQEALLDQAEKMIETVGRTVDYFANVENRMVDLVMGSVRKVVDGFDDQEKVMIVVRNALAVVRNQKQIPLRLCPGALELVRGRIHDILAAYPGVGYVDLVADARLEPGACILESEIGMVEASLEGQIAALRAAFERTLGSRV